MWEHVGAADWYGCHQPNFDKQVDTDSPEGTPSVELALQALHIGQEVNDVKVRVVLLGGNASCR